MDWKNTYDNWLAADLLDADKTTLQQMSDEDRQDAFYQTLDFGTAGMRGLMGVGTNRMNLYTVRQVTEALARYMDEQGEAAKRAGVVISYDSRHHSVDFSKAAAQVLSQHGIRVYLFSSLRPTPELSLAVRELKTFAGIMMTASHNTSEYNGYKLYGSDGAQMTPEAVSAITDERQKITDIFDIAFDEEQQHVQMIDEQIDAPYLKALQTVNVDHELIKREGADLKIVYTPLHGTGAYIAEKALAQNGFTNYITVAEQREPDGDFPTVAKPNPEDSAALTLAVEYAKRESADVAIASDPDADRLGAAVRQPDGTYQTLSGNQIAGILLHYLLRAKKNTNQLPANGAIVTSIVSSNFAKTIAADFGVETQQVLTGFKYIAEKIEHLEQIGEYEFLFGFEESFGYLVKPFVRDKDSIQALLLFAEVAAYYKSENQSIHEGLMELYDKYGYFKEKTLSFEFDGADGRDKMQALIEDARQHQPKAIGNQAVAKVEDFLQPEQTHLPKSNVMKFELADGSWVAIRPSGTEPKLKFYIGAIGDTDQQAQEKVDALTSDLNRLI